MFVEGADGSKDKVVLSPTQLKGPVAPHLDAVCLTSFQRHPGIPAQRGSKTIESRAKIA